eukprot:symbB.v1.2.027076.t1/scaffold2751.1/size71576/5
MALRSGWFSGDNFHLNRVSQVELPEDLCTEEERQTVGDANENTDPTRYGVICVDISDPRSGVDISINRETICLKDLNAAGTATSVLLTTFDLPLPDDVQWFKDKLCLHQNVEVTLCAHLWPGKPDDRRALWLELHRCFPRAALHFTGTPEFSQPRVGEDPEEPDGEVTSVHAKLIMLEFPDRLRVVISSANLLERFWDFNNEVLWVKDFPKGPDIANPAQGMLASDFGRVFGHFVVQILDQCPLKRQNLWLQRLLRFDLTCNACLVASLPGGHVPKRALQPNQVALRLSWEENETETGCVEDGESPTSPTRDLVLKKMPDMENTLSNTCRWCVVNCSTESPMERRMIKSLDQKSSNALKCAEDWGFRVGEATGLGDSEIVIERSTSTSVSTFRVVLEATDTKQFDVVDMADENWEELADFLAALEVDYGLFALRQHLGHDAWPQTQEENYVAITGSIGGQDWWLRDLDECCGRLSQDPGPEVVLPCRPRVPVEYRWFNETAPGKLVEHSSPPNAPGREKISNHGKLLARIFSDEGRKYGWIYVGSHNLTMSAWGSIQRPEHAEYELEGGDEVLWTSNRELGVLLIQSPESESPLISQAPWPFGFPLIPKCVEDIDFESEEETNEDWEEQWTWWNWSQWNADGWNGWDEYHIRLDSGDEGNRDKLMMAKHLELLSEQTSSVVNGGVAVPATSPVTPPVKAMPLATPTAVVKPAVAPVSRPRPAPKLRDVLKAAKPNWTEKDLTAVVEKLLRAQVTGFPELRDALHSSGSAALNERLRAAGQKVFAAETITALKSRVDLEDLEKPWF